MEYKIRIAQIEEIKNFETEKFGMGEFFKIEFETKEDITENEQKLEEIFMPEAKEPEDIFMPAAKEPEDIFMPKVKKLKLKDQEPWQKMGRRCGIPFSCNHCDFIGNSTSELRKHKRDLDS